MHHVVTLGRTPKELYSLKAHSRHLLETTFSEPLVRTLLRTLLYCKTPEEAPLLRTLLRTFPPDPSPEAFVVVRPLRRAPQVATSSSTETWTKEEETRKALICFSHSNPQEPRKLRDEHLKTTLFNAIKSRVS